MKTRINFSITFDVQNAYGWSDLTVDEIRESLKGKNLDESLTYIFDSLKDSSLNINQIDLKPSEIKLCHTIGGTVLVWDENDHSHPSYCHCQECKDTGKGHYNPENYWNKPEYIEKIRIEDQLSREKRERTNKKLWFQFWK